MTSMRQRARHAFALTTLAALLAVGWSPTSTPAQEASTRALAITLDDLPWLGTPPPGTTRSDLTRRLLSQFEARSVPAIGFVNCERIGDDAGLLRQWLAAGMELGNHTESHRDLNDTPLSQWLADVRSCDTTLRRVGGGPVRFFRYPFLHQGPTAERRAAARSLLDELGYAIAHVSVDNSEWVLRRPYEQALRSGDEEARARIGALFVAHILDAVQHYQSVARERAGRDVTHVLLLHANVLVADHIGTLLDSLSARDFRFVTLEEALRDPVYHRADDYIGPDGLSWLYRFEPAEPERAAWDERRERELRRAGGLR